MCGSTPIRTRSRCLPLAASLPRRLGVELASRAGTQHTEIDLAVPRLAAERFRYAMFSRSAGIGIRTLLLDQPPQFLFYGRMLTGMRRADGAFSANHSYYDSSASEEHWDDARSSVRLYPFFTGLKRGAHVSDHVAGPALGCDRTVWR